MRALLVVNPSATATTRRGRDVLTSALGRGLKLDEAVTESRGHAIALGARARSDGYDVVLVLGGDGTVNEVVNGLLADGVPQDPRDIPMLAAVPGGSTNVFARSLGYSPDAVEATSELLERLDAGQERLLGLGRADDRYFTFNAGLGLDADAVRHVEERRAAGSRASAALYIRAAVRQFYVGRARRVPVTVRAGGAEPFEAHLALVCNTRPWTYLNDRPLLVCPDASYDTGLDAFVLTELRSVPTLRLLGQTLRREPEPPHGRHLVALHDEAVIALEAEQPLPFQLDGDYVGDVERVVLRAVPDALRVIA
jgi:diacylglycerol kinase family enzyme